eukprot:5753_1
MSTQKPKRQSFLDKKWLSLVQGLSYSSVLENESAASDASDHNDIDYSDSTHSTDISAYDDDTHQLDIGVKTTIRTKMRRIEHQAAHKKIRNNRSLRDWWVWYWQAPRSRLPFVYFLVLLLSCAALSVYWFMDNDSSFILCGGIGLSMCIYSAYKFKKSINLKKEVNKFKRLNIKFKREHSHLQGCIERAVNAHQMLRHTKARLSRANDKNRKNLNRFEQVENNMRVIGKEAGTKLGDLNKITQNIRSKWREELLDQEREMLHAVWNRYAKVHTGRKSVALTKDDFKQFESMLPKRYGERFDRLGTFHTFAGDKEQINQNDFVNTLDTFAIMETDEADIDFILSHQTSEHPHVSSFRFTTSRDLCMDSK